MSCQAPDCHNCGRSRSDEFPTTSVAGRLAGTPFVGWLAVFWTRHYCAPGRAEQAYVTNEVTHFKFTRPRAEKRRIHQTPSRTEVVACRQIDPTPARPGSERRPAHRRRQRHLPAASAAIVRPIPGLGRAETPVENRYLGSAGATPGGGVHGVCGRNAARAALAGDGARGRPRRRLNQTSCP